MINREQLQAEIATQEDAIARLQARLTSAEFSRAGRAKLEREILKRANCGTPRCMISENWANRIMLQNRGAAASCCTRFA
jgi:hypothetical protein